MTTADSQNHEVGGSTYGAALIPVAYLLAEEKKKDWKDSYAS